MRLVIARFFHAEDDAVNGVNTICVSRQDYEQIKVVITFFDDFYHAVEEENNLHYQIRVQP